MKTAVYPGSFDPITYGHLDIIKRAASMFDKVIVAVMCNSAKTPLFTLDERVKMIKESVTGIDNVVVESFSGLLIDYCKKENIHIVIRGLRAITDFEYELQIAQTNKELSHDEVDTVFLTTNIKYSYLSSSVVKEVASYKGDISPCVSDFVATALYKKFEKQKDQGDV
ncbi:MAG: pantetheine-phosphate adenylyltransferase [Butyrivibrio sp.]|jgi:pantetheine-phosphate adenylyltransferase|uniref:Phosphopantetheine adenylyltransferase n=1 Tax=Butyrivibrio hungatei TaxID=185008 RepID=A0A1G5AY69_9FIRM|nr:pantetheine-phosphate adenylyltransferase [Butyrivibrio hungatei]MBQ2609385.1 pantetheine-phosphate adenylyltransferase [Butyrivibrio sp.]MBR6837363.1 pantetheine-phosphate adenylyltransferase [Oscillospiraceae bacterium]MBQ4220037.1 pantetheine-phosphate adenylyltransferase [Butyrivibrio sp.]MBR4358559.1 pantetheine-phosphate adenylyltransferase [Butyrivibrio sp.]MBR4639909.1 pantetheine-phosphate adenylyltransferase [Butyrivibrio sp.]